MKISLIIPCYNVEKYLGECLDSVYAAAIKLPSAINGETNLIEVICVDDGSTDGTGRMLDDFKARVQESECNCSVAIIHQQNGGEGAARNAGLDVMTGDWFMFLDSDDLLKDTAFVDMARGIANHQDVDLVACGLRWFDDGKTVDWPKERDYAEHEVDLRAEIPDAMAGVGVCDCVYKTNVFGGVRFTSERIGADMVYTSKCFSLAHRIVLMGVRHYAYRQRAASMANCQMTKEKMLDKIRYLQSMFANFSSSGKKLGRAFTNSRGDIWLQECPAEISKYCDERAVWDSWYASIGVARRYPIWSLWQRVVMATVGMVHGSGVTWCLCILPYKLKRLRQAL